MTLEILKQKKDFYRNKLNEIMSTSVDAEVAKRLDAIRESIAKEVIADLNKDAEKCKHYLELIDILISEVEIDEEKSEEIKTEPIENESTLEGGIDNGI